MKIKIILSIVAIGLFSVDAFALPQYRRLLDREYGYKTPCSTCHSQGGGSSLTTYGKAFDRAGKGQNAIKQIASVVPAGDKLSFDAKLKGRANPNDPASTPEKPGDWIKAGASVPTEELKSFSPAEVSSFSILEGELKSEQVTALQEKIGKEFQDEDKFPTFYFGEVQGKKKYVVQYVRAPKLKRTIGLVVDTSGSVKSIAYVGEKKKELSQELKSKFVDKKLADIEKLPSTGDEEYSEVRNSLVRGLSAISLVFAKK